MEDLFKCCRKEEKAQVEIQTRAAPPVQSKRKRGPSRVFRLDEEKVDDTIILLGPIIKSIKLKSEKQKIPRVIFRGEPYFNDGINKLGFKYCYLNFDLGGNLDSSPEMILKFGPNIQELTPPEQELVRESFKRKLCDTGDRKDLLCMTVEKYRAHLLDLNLRDEVNVELFDKCLQKLKNRRDKFIQDVVKGIEELYPAGKSTDGQLDFKKFEKDCDKNDGWNHFMYYDIKDTRGRGYYPDVLRDILQKKLIARNNENSWRIFHTWENFIDFRIKNDPQAENFSLHSKSLYE